MFFDSQVIDSTEKEKSDSGGSRPGVAQGFGLPNFGKIKDDKELMFICQRGQEMTQENCDKMIDTKLPHSQLYPVIFK